MSAIPNAQGHVWLRNGSSRRASKTTVTLRDADLVVEYFEEGYSLPATDIDDACAPTCRIMSISIGGCDVTRLIGDSRLREEIAEKIEAQWVDV